MERTNVAAFTEVTRESYPAFVSINREQDGSYTLSVRERGHGGEKQVVVTMSARELQTLASETLMGIGRTV